MLNFIRDALTGVLASLVFSVPTAILIWLLVNSELVGWHRFLTTDYLLLMVAGFAVLALILPDLFPALMAKVWRWLVQWLRWF